MRTIRSLRHRSLLALLPQLAAALMLAALPACSGDKGDAGPAGPAGTDGRDGTNGEQGPRGPNGADGQPGAPGESYTVDQALPPIEKAFVGVGGVDALEGLTSLGIESSGARWIFGEGYRPEDPAVKVSTFMLELTMDVAGDNLRLDYDRHLELLGTTADRSFSEILAGNLGVVDGTEHLFGYPGGAMASDRWASVRKQQRVLNPQLILREVAADPSLVLDDTGVALLDGSVHHLVVVDDAVSPITLWVNRATGWVNKLTYTEAEYLAGDVDVEVLYYGWESTTAGGLRFPSDVYIAVDGNIVHQEARAHVHANEAIADGTFDFPAGSDPMYDAEDAHRGEANHQFHQVFAGMGIPLDGQQLYVMPVELGDGVWHLAGGSHNSLLVEQQSSLVLVDAPLEAGRQEAILAWASATFPGKPISHVLVTHHHTDHVGGIRTIAATGATAVVSEISAKYFQRVFENRATVFPDALEMSPVSVPILEVPEDGTVLLDDPLRPVRAYHIATEHAADMLIIHVPSAEVVFEADLLNTAAPLTIPPNFVPNGMALVAGINAAGIASPTLKIAAGHGAGTNTLAEAQAALGL